MMMSYQFIAVAPYKQRFCCRLVGRPKDTMGSAKRQQSCLSTVVYQVVVALSFGTAKLDRYDM